MAAVDHHEGSVEALEEAPSHYVALEIFNTDRGSQLITVEFTGAPLAKGIAIRTDGKGLWRDNVFVKCCAWPPPSSCTVRYMRE